MPKANGKDLEFWFGGVEIPITGTNYSSQFDTVDSTDTATPATGKDNEVIRAARTFTVEAQLYEPEGAEIATGSLVAGTRYRVTAGTITETQGSFTSGQIFESDGTGTASASNKVKPLGVRVTGKDMAFTFDSVEVPVTDMEYALKFDEVDVTDTSTAGDAKETEVTRADRETKVTCIVRTESADLLTTAPDKESAEIAFSSNCKVAGKVIVTSKNNTNTTTEFAKMDYTMKWVGAPTESNMGIAAGTSAAFKITLKRGSTTNKEYSGTAICTGKTVKANVSGTATVSYTFNVNGAITESVAN